MSRAPRRPARRSVPASTLLADLRRLRELQLAQLHAVAERDLDRLADATRERAALQAALVPLERAGLSPQDLAEARAIAEALAADQPVLIAAAAGEAERLRGEVQALARGRAAVAGYRPPAAGRAVYLDSAG